MQHAHLGLRLPFEPMSTHSLFVLAVVAHQGRYLIVEERDGTFYLPAGRVEPGENLMAAIVRETIEEAGMLIGLRGILGIDHSSGAAGGKLRFCYVGYPAIAQPPKSQPDQHSRGAAWLTKDELERRPLRHPEVLDWITRWERNEPLLPCRSYSWG
jgi:8-oxo-dGTP pyrophosphatase MutT (NUDIX family)